MVSLSASAPAFRAWCTAEHVPVAIASVAFAHERKSCGGGVLRRAEMLEDRREWMEKWATFPGGADADNVVPMKRVTA